MAAARTGAARDLSRHPRQLPHAAGAGLAGLHRRTHRRARARGRRPRRRPPARTSRPPGSTCGSKSPAPTGRWSPRANRARARGRRWPPPTARSPTSATASRPACCRPTTCRAASRSGRVRSCCSSRPAAASRRHRRPAPADRRSPTARRSSRPTRSRRRRAPAATPQTLDRRSARPASRAGRARPPRADGVDGADRRHRRHPQAHRGRRLGLRLRAPQSAHLPAPGQVAGVVGRLAQRELAVLGLGPRRRRAHRGAVPGRWRSPSARAERRRRSRADVQKQLVELASARAALAPARLARHRRAGDQPRGRRSLRGRRRHHASTSSTRSCRCCRPSSIATRVLADIRLSEARLARVLGR